MPSMMVCLHHSVRVLLRHNEAVFPQDPFPHFPQETGHSNSYSHILIPSGEEVVGGVFYE